MKWQSIWKMIFSRRNILRTYNNQTFKYAFFYCTYMFDSLWMPLGHHHHHIHKKNNNNELVNTFIWNPLIFKQDNKTNWASQQIRPALVNKPLSCIPSRHVFLRRHRYTHTHIRTRKVNPSNVHDSFIHTLNNAKVFFRFGYGQCRGFSASEPCPAQKPFKPPKAIESENESVRIQFGKLWPLVAIRIQVTMTSIISTNIHPPKILQAKRSNVSP